MGRPVNKSKIGSGSGRIAVSKYRFTGGSELSSPAAYIVSQKGTQKFRVTDGTTTETLQLVDKASSLSEGEFTINAVLDDSTVVQITKLKNRTITYDDSTQIQYEVGGTSGGVHDTGDSIASVESQ